MGSDTFDDQQTRTFFREALHTFKLDYTYPFKEVWKLEGGFQFSDNDMSNDFEVKDDFAGLWLVNPGLTNVF